MYVIIYIYTWEFFYYFYSGMNSAFTLTMLKAKSASKQARF